MRILLLIYVSLGITFLCLCLCEHYHSAVASKIMCSTSAFILYYHQTYAPTCTKICKFNISLLLSEKPDHKNAQPVCMTRLDGGQGEGRCFLEVPLKMLQTKNRDIKSDNA